MKFVAGQESHFSSSLLKIIQRFFPILLWMILAKTSSSVFCWFLTCWVNKLDGFYDGIEIINGKRMFEIEELSWADVLLELKIICSFPLIDIKVFPQNVETLTDYIQNWPKMTFNLPPLWIELGRGWISSWPATTQKITPIKNNLKNKNIPIKIFFFPMIFSQLKINSKWDEISSQLLKDEYEENIKITGFSLRITVSYRCDGVLIDFCCNYMLGFIHTSREGWISSFFSKWNW